MATAHDVTFRLERFGWARLDQLEVVGRWSGVDDVPEDEVFLSAHAGPMQRRVPATPGSVREENGVWMALFPSSDESLRFTQVELHLSDLAVELPRPSNVTRRFGRPLLRARRVQRPARPAVAAVEDPLALERESQPEPAAEEDGIPNDPLDLHTALLEARDDLEEANATAAHAREEAELARHDAERERERRRGEAARMREALATARTLADEQLAGMRQQLRDHRAEFDRVSEQLAAERLARSSMADELSGLRSQLEEAGQREEEFRRTRAELEDAHGRLRSLETQLEDAREEMRQEAGAREQLATQARDAEASTRAELERLRDELSESRTALEDAGEELRRRQEEVERLRGEMADLQRLAEELQQLRDANEALRQRAAEAERLTTQLAEARQAAAEAHRRAAGLEERLEGVRRALEEPVSGEQTAPS